MDNPVSGACSLSAYMSSFLRGSLCPSVSSFLASNEDESSRLDPHVGAPFPLWLESERRIRFLEKDPCVFALLRAKSHVSLSLPLSSVLFRGSDRAMPTRARPGCGPGWPESKALARGGLGRRMRNAAVTAGSGGRGENTPR